jgi:hypothetical protein
MRFRPANISLINRRHYLPRLLLTMSSIKTDDHLTMTGHYISGPSGRPPARNPKLLPQWRRTQWNNMRGRKVR